MDHSSKGPSGIAPLSADRIGEHNHNRRAAIDEDYSHLEIRLARRGVEIETLTTAALEFAVALPSWALTAGGTRFGRFQVAGEPRTIIEKMEDCAAINALVRVTPAVSIHIPWDRPDCPAELAAFAASCGLRIDSTNSNTFQDHPGQEHSYRFGSLTHTDPAVRRQAIDHNIECLALGAELGADAHTVWIGDGANYPGQVHARGALDRYLDSVADIYSALPGNCRLFLEHKLYEPAFYATVISDWGTSYVCAQTLGERAFSLVDLGHHAPNVNIEMIVARLIQLGKLAGFHFNDSKYGDDDLDAGSIKPFQLFLVFNELIDASTDPSVRAYRPAYMLDQSHAVTDPAESLMTSAIELVRAYVQAQLVDRAALAHYQERNDALMALQVLKDAFTCDVSPILAMARSRAGGAIEPVAAFREARYREAKGKERHEQIRQTARAV